MSVLDILVTIGAVITCLAGCWYFNEKFKIERDKAFGEDSDYDGSLRV